VLERHIDVGDDPRMVGEKLDELVVDGLGVKIEEAHPADPVDFRHALHEGGEGAALGLRQVAPVGDGVLRDQIELDHALRGELLGLAHDVIGAARALLAAKLGDRAKRADAVAAFGDFDVRVHVGAGQNAGVFGADDPVGRVADEHAIGAAAQHVPQLEHVARAEKVVDLGHLRRELGRVAL